MVWVVGVGGGLGFWSDCLMVELDFLVGVLLECVFVWETIVRFLMEILYEIRVRNYI